jgi:hypothetical protein
LAGESAQAKARNELRVAAFVGWQVRSAVGMGKQPPSFKKYLKQLGLEEPERVTRGQLEREKAAARAASEKVREAFSRGAQKADI